MLLDEGLISEYQLAVALGQHRQWGGKLGRELVQRGFITEDDLCSVLERQLGITWLSLRDIPISPEAVKTIKHDTVKKFTIMPIAVDDAVCTVATEDPKDLKTLDTLSFVTGKNIRPVLATNSDIRWAIGRYYEGRVDEDAPARLKKPYTKPQKSALMAKLETVKARDTIGALLSLLVEKGIITEEELLLRIKQQSGAE